MVRSRKGPILALLPLVLLAAASPAAASRGNANFVLGSRALQDDSFWEPNETHQVFGATVSFGADDWPIDLAAGTYLSARERTIYFSDPDFGTIRGDFITALAEFTFGVQKTWALGAHRPYLGGGLASVGAAAEFDGPGGADVDDVDQSAGIYVEGGIFWRLGSRFNIGLHTRGLFATDVEFDFDGPITARGDADYVQAGLILGWGWPAE